MQVFRCADVLIISRKVRITDSAEFSLIVDRPVLVAVGFTSMTFRVFSGNGTVDMIAPDSHLTK